jgi:hypothetical protein
MQFINIARLKSLCFLAVRAGAPKGLEVQKFAGKFFTPPNPKRLKAA